MCPTTGRDPRADGLRGAHPLTRSNPPISWTSGSSTMPLWASHRPADQVDQRQDVVGARPLVGDDEVRVLVGDLRAADPGPLQPGFLDQSRGVSVGRVLEHASAVRLGERLGPSPPLASLVHRGADREADPPAGARTGRPSRRHRRAARSGDRRIRPPPRARAPRARPRAGRPRSSTRTSAICPPWAPAFIFTAPPSVAGIATPKARPSSACRSATPASAGRGIDPPAVRRSPSRAAHRYPRPRRSTRPSNPRSETRTFDPFPITTNAISPSATACAAAARSASDSGSRYRAADPPIRNVVSGAIAKEVRTRSPHAARRIASRPGDVTHGSRPPPSRSTAASASIHTSPQPIVTTRSPSRTSRSRKSITSAR